MSAAPRSGSVHPAFDVERLALQLGRVVGDAAAGDAIDAVALPLGLLVGDLGRADLSPAGARLVAAEMLRFLVVRADLGTLADRDPFAGEVVVVTGPPRTGSTFLHHLLALDPGTSRLTLARALSPTAPNDQARVFAAGYLAMADRLSPRLRRLHPMSADGPEECITALQPTFVSERFLCTFDLPTYGRWFEDQDLGSTYAWYSRLLGRLFPPTRPLVLKAPAHLARLDAFRSAFPSARYVLLDRDPDEVTSSFVELVSATRQVYARRVDADAISAEWGPRLERAREAVPAWAWVDHDRVRHVAFQELVGDPAHTLSALYDWLGWVPGPVQSSWPHEAAVLAATHARGCR